MQTALRSGADVTTVMFFDDSVFLERRPQQLPVYGNIVRALDQATWIMLAVVFVTVTLVLYVMVSGGNVKQVL